MIRNQRIKYIGLAYIHIVCKKPLLARALGLKLAAARQSARATIGYLVNKLHTPQLIHKTKTFKEVHGMVEI